MSLSTPSCTYIPLTLRLILADRIYFIQASKSFPKLAKRPPLTLLQRQDKPNKLRWLWFFLLVRYALAARPVPAPLNPIAKIPRDKQIIIESLGTDFHRVTFNFGFKERVNVSARLKYCRKIGLNLDFDKASYYLGCETIAFKRSRNLLTVIGNSIFAFLNRNAGRATIFYKIPVNRVVEMGSQVEI